MAAVSTAGTYMEGTLLKRSRGRNPSRMRVKKKWVQKRYCRLTKDTFDYFDSPKKGSKPDTVIANVKYLARMQLNVMQTTYSLSFTWIDYNLPSLRETSQSRWRVLFYSDPSTSACCVHSICYLHSI